MFRIPTCSIGANFLVKLGALAVLSLATFCSPVSAANLTASNDTQLNTCNTTLTAGGTCTVSAGTYSKLIAPSNSGTASARITYVCPSQACTIKVNSGNSLDMRGKSYITVDGFTFEDGILEPWGFSSAGNLLDNISTQELNGAPPFASISTGGGTDNELRNFNLNIPPDNINKPNPLNVGVNATTAELRTKITNGVLRGSWNGMALKSCKDCVIDGVRFIGAKNHTLDLANGGAGVTNLTFQNCMIMPSTGFREANPEVLGAINGLTVLNSFIVTGYVLPSIGHETQLSGVVTLHNNIFVNMGTGGGEVLGQVNNKSAVTWDIDYNAYVYAGNSNITFWRDSRGASTIDYPLSNFAGWKALGFDQHSIVLDNSDYKSTTGPNASPLWGSTGPSWGGMIECMIGNNTFATGTQWGEGFAVGNNIEFDWDGIPRTVTAVGTGVCGTTAETTVTFTPPLSGAPGSYLWFLNWGKSPGVGKTYIPQAGSRVIDAGDDASCAHTKLGAHCDIGPSEYNGNPGDTMAPAAPRNLTVSP